MAHVSYNSPLDDISHHRFSVDEYEGMVEAGILTESDKVELIGGHIVDMNPIGSRHAAVVSRSARLIQKLLGEQYLLRVQLPVRLGEASEPEPDLAVVAFREDEYIERHPEAGDIKLLIEVSESSLKFDRETKGPLYAAHGIPEYWIMSVDRREIEVYREPADGRYGVCEVKRAGDVIQPAGLGDLKLEVGACFPGRGE